jgi:D-sedoheptulose 7-phosphate isomerase
VITLGTNQTVTTAWGNDHGFEGQFAREVQAFGDERSVLLGITTSGKSVNLNNAFLQARNLGMATIALASERAEEFLADKTDCLLAVPGLETHKIQESHIVVYHALCIYIEQNLPQQFTSQSLES